MGKESLFKETKPTKPTWESVLDKVIKIADKAVDELEVWVDKELVDKAESKSKEYIIICPHCKEKSKVKIG